jgi:hypothetical protein
LAKRRKWPYGFPQALTNIGPARLILSLILAVFGGWFAYTLAASGINRSRNPQVALSFTATESGALAEQADRLFFGNPQSPSPKIKEMAIAALRQQAANPKALRLLGYYADVKRQSSQARNAINVSLKLSRREPGTHLWLIEDSAREGRTAQTLKHYDLLLRTKPASQALLFPRLENAISDPGVRAALKPYMKSKKAWVSAFLGQLVGASKNLSPVVSLVVDSNGFPPTDASRGQEQSLLKRLAVDKRFDDVHRVFMLVPGAKASRLTNASFDAADRDGVFGPVGWHIVDDPDVGGGFTSGGSRSKPFLQVYANGSTRGLAASKLLYLRGGNYRFRAELSSIDRGDGGSLRWQLRCANAPENQPIWILEMDRKTANMPVTVPADCKVQYLDILMSGGSGQTGSEALIKSVSIDVRAN